MLLETLRHGFLARLIEFRFTITVVTCLLLVITTALVGDEPDNLLCPEKNKALITLRRLPNDVEKPYSWGYVGGYRTSPDNTYNDTAYCRTSSNSNCSLPHPYFASSGCAVCF